MRILFGVLLALSVSAPALAACPPLLNHTFPSLTDQATPLCQFEGKVLLVVNTASECGYTPQYEGLEALYRRYREKGLVVLGFPANDFGGQEPGANREIAKFCEVNYGVSFPMFAKSGVSAGNANPLYATLAVNAAERPTSDFPQYLIDRTGQEVLSFGGGVSSGGRKVVDVIERMLAVFESRP